MSPLSFKMIPMRKQCLLLLWLVLGGGNCLLPASSSRRIHRSTPHRECQQISTIPCMVSQSVDEGLSHKKLKEIEQNIVRLGRSGRTDDALALYSEIGKPTIRLLNGAIDACSRARATRLDKAFEILKDGVRTKNLQPNVFTFGALMSACSRARDAKQALELLRSMQEEYGVTPNAVVYSSAISACARSQPPRSETAMNLLRDAVEIKKIPMNVIGFNAAVSACAQAGDWENAITLLTRMEDASFKNSTALQALIPAPDAVTYGTVFAACEKGEQWELILKYARSMQDRNLELDGLAVTSCLHACQQLGLADEALEYLHAMKFVAPPSRQTFGLKRYGAKKPLQGPDDVAYRLAISACARGGAWEEGIRLLDNFEAEIGTPADVVAYTSAITGCEYAGEWKQAFLVLNKMRKAGVDANEVTMAAVIGACATACANQSKTIKDGLMPVPQQKALRLLYVMKRDPSIVSPNIQVYNAAIRACAEAHDIKRAFKLMEEIEEAEIERTEITYGSLMTACERVGCVESVSKVFRKMKADDIAPNEIIYGAAISCCRKAGKSERALLLLRKMLQEELSPNVATFNTVLVAQTEGRSKMDMERLVLVFKLMKSKYADENARPNRQTYSLLIRFFSANKQPMTAEAFIQKMREDGFVPDVDLFTATVAGYERIGQPLKALRLMESMQEDGYDFYGLPVLNLAFANAVKLVSRVGRGLSSTEKDEVDAPLELNDADEEGDAFVKQTSF